MRSNATPSTRSVITKTGRPGGSPTSSCSISLYPRCADSPVICQITSSTSPSWSGTAPCARLRTEQRNTEFNALINSAANAESLRSISTATRGLLFCPCSDERNRAMRECMVLAPWSTAIQPPSSHQRHGALQITPSSQKRVSVVHRSLNNAIPSLAVAGQDCVEPTISSLRLSAVTVAHAPQTKINQVSVAVLDAHKRNTDGKR